MHGGQTEDGYRRGTAVTQFDEKSDVYGHVRKSVDGKPGIFSFAKSFSL